MPLELARNHNPSSPIGSQNTPLLSNYPGSGCCRYPVSQYVSERIHRDAVGMVELLNDGAIPTPTGSDTTRPVLLNFWYPVVEDIGDIHTTPSIYRDTRWAKGTARCRRHNSPHWVRHLPLVDELLDPVVGGIGDGRGGNRSSVDGVGAGEFSSRGRTGLRACRVEGRRTTAGRSIEAQGGAQVMPGEPTVSRLFAARGTVKDSPDGASPKITGDELSENLSVELRTVANRCTWRAERPQEGPCPVFEGDV